MRITHRRIGGGRRLLLIAALLPGIALANPTITSTDVTLLDPVYGNVGPDNVLAGDSIVAGDSTQIGSMVLLSGESIEVSATSFIYNVLGGVLPCPISGDSCTGYGTGAAYLFNNIQFSSPGGYIESVTSTLTDATYASLPGFSFTHNSITMDVGFGELGLPNYNTGAQDFGAVELDITVGQQSTGLVPEPASLSLFCGTLGLLAWRRSRARSAAPK